MPGMRPKGDSVRLLACRVRRRPRPRRPNPIAAVHKRRSNGTGTRLASRGRHPAPALVCTECAAARAEGRD
jgi:hypothetical protein